MELYTILIEIKAALHKILLVYGNNEDFFFLGFSITKCHPFRPVGYPKLAQSKEQEGQEEPGQACASVCFLSKGSKIWTRKESLKY